MWMPIQGYISMGDIRKILDQSLHPLLPTTVSHQNNSEPRTFFTRQRSFYQGDLPFHAEALARQDNPEDGVQRPRGRPTPTAQNPPQPIYRDITPFSPCVGLRGVIGCRPSACWKIQPKGIQFPPLQMMIMRDSPYIERGCTHERLTVSSPTT